MITSAIVNIATPVKRATISPCLPDALVQRQTSPLQIQVRIINAKVINQLIISFIGIGAVAYFESGFIDKDKFDHRYVEWLEEKVSKGQILPLVDVSQRRELLKAFELYYHEEYGEQLVSGSKEAFLKHISRNSG